MTQSLTKRDEEKEKRTRELAKIIEIYLSNWNAIHEHKLKARPNAAKKWCAVYYDFLDSTIKQYLTVGKYANRYKVASGTEISCMNVLPIQIIGEYNLLDLRKMNALFATFAAFYLLLKLTNLPLVETNADEDLLQIWTAHIKWLTSINSKNKNLENTPTFANAIFWETFMLAYKRILPSV